MTDCRMITSPQKTDDYKLLQESNLTVRQQAGRPPRSTFILLTSSPSVQLSEHYGATGFKLGVLPTTDYSTDPPQCNE